MSVYKQGQTILGYEIIRKYGDGGMSDVYLAQNKDLDNWNPNKYVIIKVIKNRISKDGSNSDIDQWKKAIDEFKITCTLFENTHENIVKPIKWDYSNSNVIIIYEFIDGPSLNQFIDIYRAIPVDRAMFYFKKICEGIRHFHNLNDKTTVIHRDLKPENIILTNDLADIKIIDYGIATTFYDKNINSSEGTIYCTVDYITPDIFNLSSKNIKNNPNIDINEWKNKVITTQFDFHALGVILYYMITGEMPFEYDKEKISDAEIIRNWLKYDLKIISNSIPNIPNSIENIIFRCTASKPEDLHFRYKKIEELIDDINTWDDPKRKNEKLLKPIEKRVFQQAMTFDVAKEKEKEKFYEKWWFYIIVSVVVAVAVVLIVVMLVLYFTGVLSDK